MRSQCMSRPRAISSGPTTGELFSTWQATTQALQPMHSEVSITIPHRAPPRVSSGKNDASATFSLASEWN